MYAVIATGGKQFRVTQGQKLKVEKLAVEVGTTVDFPVLMMGEGANIKVGTPLISGSKVSATVIGHGRGDKIRVVKHRRRKHYHKEMGHRQYHTEVEITHIS